MKQKLRPYLPGILLFALFLIVSICTFKDYGVAWDEPFQEQTGTIYYNYALHGDQTLMSYSDRVYGAAYELPLIFIERILNLKDTRDIYLMRHFVTHVFFLFAALCGYVLFYRLFRKRSVACLGFVLLVCTPRLYAHSYFNSKDLPLLSMFLICFAVAQYAFEQNKKWWYLLLGALCGYTTAIRVPGVILPAILAAFLVVDIITAIATKKSVAKAIGHLGIFTLGFALCLYISWPTLWTAPITNFVAAYNAMSHFTFWGGKLLFAGHIYGGTTIPWYYAPVWFCISTPLLWLPLGLSGILLILVAFFRRPLVFITNTTERNYTLYMACFLLPVLATIILQSVLYDDWRQLYFIYPGFVLIVLYAINKLLETRWKKIVGALCTLQIAVLIFFMIKSHPFQQVYFNELVSHKDEAIRKNYDYEYWGCGYKEALESILAKDTSAKIRIFLSLDPIRNNIAFLPPQYRDRFELVDRDQLPYYFITNFRNHAEDYEYPEIFYNIKVQNSSLLRVYKCY